MTVLADLGGLTLEELALQHDVSFAGASKSVS